MIAGLMAPVAVPAWLWRQTSFRALAGPTFGAVVVAITANLTLKVVTGRASPEAPFPTDLVARSQSFAFGIARGGIVEGWPSGHAMTNVAMATALIALTPDLRVRAAATGWAAWVVAAVIFGISGDLAKKMTFRALYRLEERGKLDCPIVGVRIIRLPNERFTAMMRLDHNRAMTQVAQKTGVRTRGQLVRVALEQYANQL